MTLTPHDPDDTGGTSHRGEAEEQPRFDLGELLSRAQAVQQQLLDARAAVGTHVVEGQAGGGVVSIRVTGNLEFQEVRIDPKVVDPAEVEMLEDLVLAALRSAMAQVDELKTEAIGGFSGAIGGLLP